MGSIPFAACNKINGKSKYGRVIRRHRTDTIGRAPNNSSPRRTDGSVRTMTAVAAESDPLARLAALPGVTDSVTAARTSVDTLLRHRVMRRDSAKVTAEASLRTARASAALEGYDIGLDGLRTHLARDPSTPTADAGESIKVTLGAVRLYAELGTLHSAWERAPRQALARMHMLVARGLIADADLGRPRAADQSGPEALDTTHPADPLGLGPAPAPGETAARLGGLTELLLARTTAPAIIVAAIVEGELLAVRPFGRFDGIVARAAGRLVLISRGLDPKAVTATDVGHVEAAQASADDYAGAARAYTAAGADGVGRWIIHYARALELGARESLAVCEAIARTN